MPKDLTIAEAARRALEELGRPSPIDAIYEEIVSANLYRFNTEVPKHVLRTEIRRRTEGVERVDSRDEIIFILAGDEIYGLRGTPAKKRGTAGTKRVNRAPDKEDVIKLLLAEPSGVFREIWRVLLFAAVLGFQRERREKLVAVEAGRGIDQGSFGNNPVWPGILYLMNLTEADSTDVLKATETAEDERIKVFEEYANGGLAILKEEFASRSYSLPELLDFIHAEMHTAETAKPNLSIVI